MAVAQISDFEELLCLNRTMPQSEGTFRPTSSLFPETSSCRQSLLPEPHLVIMGVHAGSLTQTREKRATAIDDQL